MKKSPSSTSRKGRISVSIWWRYSVSLSIMPATKAPKASDKPNRLVNQAAVSDTNNTVKVKSSGERAAATRETKGATPTAPVPA